MTETHPLDVTSPRKRPLRPYRSLGGTDIATLAQENPYETVDTLLQSFLAPPLTRGSHQSEERLQDAPFLWRGLYQEPVIRQLLWDWDGLDCGPPHRIEDAVQDGCRMHASIDGFPPEGSAIHDYKVLVYPKFKELKHTRQLPQHWKWQAEHYLALSGRTEFHFHVLECCYWNYTSIEYRSDPAMAAQRIDLIRTFAAHLPEECKANA